MNKEDLKNKIETFYVQSLNMSNPDFLIGLDAIKSIIGIELSQINTNLLDWFSDSINDVELSEYIQSNFEDIPGAISFYSLESALLKNNKEKSYESIFYLSKVSEGTQIFEFLLEFSLRYTEDRFRYIWHIMRLEKFFDGKYRIESLNRCIELLIDDDYIEYTPSMSNSFSNWEGLLGLETNNNILLYYTIYNSELIRLNYIRRLIIGRLERMDIKNYSKTDTNVKEEQILEGRTWINKYFNTLKIDAISLNQVILFDQVRSCLLFSKQDIDIKLFWNHLNKSLCN